jgi:hypothetical protein
MKQTKPSILELRSLSPVFGGPVVERGDGVTKANVSRWAILAAAAAYFVVWSVSLAVALQDHSRELVPPDGHGALEVAFLTLVAITQPLGMLAGPIVGSFAQSGRTGVVLVWLVAGVLGAAQWIGVVAGARAVWAQFRPTRSALHIR